MTPDNPYTKMQHAFYVSEAAKWSPDNRDPVVGSFDAHNAHADYDLLFDRGIGANNKIALDFGCGPGRSIVRFKDVFFRIDGVDIAIENLVNAHEWAKRNSAPIPTLYKSSGVDLAEVPSGVYDVVFSTICLQHIPVYEIRVKLFREFHRVLVPGGWFTAQMGYGETSDSRGVDYYANKYDAQETNGRCDVNVTSVTELYGDLVNAGFDGNTYSSVIRPTGPGDWHPQWIFFRARKPWE